MKNVDIKGPIATMVSIQFSRQAANMVGLISWKRAVTCTVHPEKVIIET